MVKEFVKEVQKDGDTFKYVAGKRRVLPNQRETQKTGLKTYKSLDL